MKTFPLDSLRTRRRHIRALTLTELLVVIAIIGVLAALLFPAFTRARERANEATCVNRLKNIVLAEANYSADNDGTFVPYQASGNILWTRLLAPYATGKSFEVKDNQWIRCPSSNKKTVHGYISGIGPVFGTHANNPTVHAEWDKTPTRRVSIKSPAKTPSWMDVCGGSESGYPAFCRGCYPSGRGFRPENQIDDPNNFTDRHRDGGHVAFADGHIEWVAITTMQKMPVQGGDDFFQHYPQ